jgi:hypothetical protein
MFTMTLGLINGPFASYNLISAQWSHVLAKVPDGHRLNFKCPMGPKKEHMYAFFFSKSPVNKHPPGSPTGPLRRELLVYRVLFTYLPKSS